MIRIEVDLKEKSVLVTDTSEKLKTTLYREAKVVPIYSHNIVEIHATKDGRENFVELIALPQVRIVWKNHIEA